MWTPAILATIVALATIILLTILEKRGKIERGTKLYGLLETVGLTIPILIICGNYAYMKTDTLLENIIVVSGIYACLGLFGLFSKFGINSKYNYIYFPMTILACYFICNYITTFMLSSFDSGLFAGVIGATSGTVISQSKKKGRLIISSIIIFIIIVTAPMSYLKNFETKNKVETIATAYVKNLGYDMIDQDKVAIWSSANRYEEIQLSIVRVELEGEWKLLRYLEMVYSNGKIIEFKEE